MKFKQISEGYKGSLARGGVSKKKTDSTKPYSGRMPGPEHQCGCDHRKPL